MKMIFQKDTLHYAVKKNLKEIGKLLISKGADINLKDLIFQMRIIGILIGWLDSEQIRYSG